MKKRNNNPFKMLGSWIGVVIGFILSETTNIFSICYFNKCFLPSSALLLSSIAIIIGFLTGWGIESLWRKFK